MIILTIYISHSLIKLKNIDTFTASFTAVFLTFLFFFCAVCLIFGGVLLVAGRAEPNCIVASGESFGPTPHTEFSDAFGLSLTTFFWAERGEARKRNKAAKEQMKS